jgi:hypothetical protein
MNEPREFIILSRRRWLSHQITTSNRRFNRRRRDGESFPLMTVR